MSSFAISVHHCTKDPSQYSKTREIKVIKIEKGEKYCDYSQTGLCKQEIQKNL